MKRNRSVPTPHRQYTLRAVPGDVDRAARQRARREGRSLNAVLVDALASGLGIHTPANDLGSLAGSWIDDPAFDAALAAQDRVDSDMWR